MAQVIATIRVMPAGTDTDLDELAKRVKEVLESHSAEMHQLEKKPVAFGLYSLDFMVSRDEDRGSFDELEAELRKIEGVNSAETIDVRRSVG